MLKKLISGGQTGVDRGALDAALAAGFPCGGSCPAGRKAEDGPIPRRYPVVELRSTEYARRTRQNVADADGTLIIYFTRLSGGTLKTLRLCEAMAKPFLLIDGDAATASEAAAKAKAFITAKAIAVLNVAGPRESGHAGARDYAEALIGRLLRLLVKERHGPHSLRALSDRALPRSRQRSKNS